jgi:hypothetical protein
MINWMRNHASAAHTNDIKVVREELIGLALILQKNLFETALTNPGHSVSSLFGPVKASVFNAEQLQIHLDEIEGLRPQDVRVFFGFLLDTLSSENSDYAENASKLFPATWLRADEDLRKTVGLKYHTLRLDLGESTSEENRGTRNRILNLLVQVKGIHYIPEATRSLLYKRAAKKLAEAKDGAYGWYAEGVAAKTLAQLGPHVPSIAFESVYQEIISVCCGNYWGRSEAFSYLSPFIEILNTEQIRKIILMFRENERVKSELFQEKPKL